MKKQIAACLACAALSVGAAASAQAQATPAPQTHSEHDKTQKHEGSAAADQQHPMPAMTDAQFASMMVKHHQGGIEMARIEEQRGSSAAVKALATKIRESQERDIAAMKPYATSAASCCAQAGHAAGHPAPGGSTPSDHAASGAANQQGPGHADHHAMMEQQSQAMMKRLQSASGSDLDQAFLEEMAKHHRMALQMIEHTTFQNAELRRLADRMKADQQQEMDEIAKLGGRAEPSK